jgi:hypothetical protein
MKRNCSLAIKTREQKATGGKKGRTEGTERKRNTKKD